MRAHTFWIEVGCFQKFQGVMNMFVYQPKKDSTVVSTHTFTHARLRTHILTRSWMLPKISRSYNVFVCQPQKDSTVVSTHTYTHARVHTHILNRSWMVPKISRSYECVCLPVSEGQYCIFKCSSNACVYSTSVWCSFFKISYNVNVKLGKGLQGRKVVCHID